MRRAKPPVGMRTSVAVCTPPALDSVCGGTQTGLVVNGGQRRTKKKRPGGEHRYHG